jgi:DNA-binding CsgD family transcriptional regulator
LSKFSTKEKGEMRNRTRANYEEAARLRAQGQSYSEIGDQLGCSKQYVAKLLKGAPSSSTKPSTPASTDSVNQLTPRQRRFAKGLAEGKTQKQAAIEAAPPVSATDNALEQWASRTVRDPKFQKGFEAILAENGLSLAEIARVHRDNLAATKIVATASQDGRITDVLERPDYATRQRAVSDGYRIHGKMKPEANNEPPPPAKILVLSQRDAERLRVFTGGLPLPPNFQIAPEGVADGLLDDESKTVDTSAEEVLPQEVG